MTSALLRFTAVAGLAATGAVVAAPAVPAWSLLPLPAKARPAMSGAVAIGDGTQVQVKGGNGHELKSIVDRFVQRVATTNGLHLNATATKAAQPAITFNVDPGADIKDDAGYRITIGAGGIEVLARTPRGAFYGSVTLWQLLTPAGYTPGKAVNVADGVIDDQPRLAWRAILLDSGRHFQSVADIKRLIDWMSLQKLNVLLWHVTEDQGWRLEIPKYPLLTKIGACRKAVGLDAELSGSPDKPYCGFYTEADARDVVRYAAGRYVEVVPEFDLPGHSQAAIAAYPSLGVTGKRPDVWTDWGVSPWLLKPDAKTLQFVDDVLDQMMRLFPSKYISIGGDEADKQQWNASPETQAKMRSLNLSTMDDLQGWFMAQVADHLVRHGRTPVGWDDELAAGAKLPASQVVMSWHGDHDERVALSALQQGHDVIMTPQESLYFDHLQTTHPDEWAGPPPAASLRDAYQTIVIPKGATQAQATHVIGVQGGLWTEQKNTFAHDQQAVFPRIAALAELGWSPAGTGDWNGFLQRMPAQLARYRALGIDYADTPFAPEFKVAAAGDDAFSVEISNQVAWGTIRYTTDGSNPTNQSTPYARPLTIKGKATTLRAATFASDGFELAAPRTQVLDGATMQSRDGSALATCSGELPSRLDGRLQANGKRPTYSVEIGHMCWQWPRAPLDGAGHVALTIEHMAWRYGDEARDAKVYPKASAAGEFQIHADSCQGPLLASLPLQDAAQARGQVRLDATMARPAGAGVHDVCVIATGDPRDGPWAIARMVFSK